MNYLAALSIRLGIMISSILIESFSERKYWVQYLRVIQYYGWDSAEVKAASQDVLRNYSLSIRIACWILYFSFSKPFGMVCCVLFFIFLVASGIFILATKLVG